MLIAIVCAALVIAVVVAYFVLRSSTPSPHVNENSNQAALKAAHLTQSQNQSSRGGMHGL